MTALDSGMIRAIDSEQAKKYFNDKGEVTSESTMEVTALYTQGALMEHGKLPFSKAPQDDTYFSFSKVQAGSSGTLMPAPERERVLRSNGLHMLVAGSKAEDRDPQKG